MVACYSNSGVVAEINELDKYADEILFNKHIDKTGDNTESELLETSILKEENKKIKNALKDTMYLLGAVAYYSDSGYLSQVEDLIKKNEKEGLFHSTKQKEKEKK